MPTPSLFACSISANRRCGLALGQRGRRLVEDQHRELGAERLGDLDHLLLGARESCDPLPRLERKAEPLEDLVARVRCMRALVEKAAARQLGAEEQVLLDGQRRHQREFLEHGADAERARLMDRCSSTGSPRKRMRCRRSAVARRRGSRSASICRRRSRRTGHAPRPARSVEIDLVERDHAGELLGSSLGLHNRRGRGRPASRTPSAGANVSVAITPIAASAAVATSVDGEHRLEVGRRQRRVVSNVLMFVLSIT